MGIREGKALLKGFENMINRAKLNAIAKASLERPFSEEETEDYHAAFKATFPEHYKQIYGELK